MMISRHAMIITAFVWTLSTLRRVLHNLGALSDGRHISSDVCDASLLSLEQVHLEFIIAENLEGLSDSEEVALDHVKDALTLLRNISDDVLVERYPPPVTYTGMVGRPRFMIPREKLFFSN